MASPDRAHTGTDPDGRAAHLAADHVPILMYHSVALTAARGFARFVVDPQEFATQMAYLSEEGYCPVSAAELANRRKSGLPLPRRAVVLTFDDAFADFEATALPILCRYGFPSTLYVPTRYAGRTAAWLTDCGEDRRPILSWSALQDVSSAGVEVAAHSHTHPQLDRIRRTAAADEVQRSRLLIEDKLGIAVEGFAYPFGYWNSRVRSAVEHAGFAYACAVGELETASTDHPLTLPRLTVNAGIGVEGLVALLSASSTDFAHRAATAKRVVWSCLRRVRIVGGDPQPARSA